MAFVDLQNFTTAPPRIMNPPRGNILDAFPAKDIDPHTRLGYSFRGEPCNSFEDYDPDICAFPADAKMDPDEFIGNPKDAQLRVIQSAFKCSAVGATDAELRSYAQSAINRNLWRSADQTLVTMLNVEDSLQPGNLTPRDILAEAAQYLATNSYAGTGVIYGSAAWFTAVYPDLIVEEGNRFRDHLGNIVIPSSVDLAVVYAFDSEVDIRTSEISLLDEYAPGIRLVNDRVVRAELIYTMAMDNCVVGSFTIAT